MEPVSPVERPRIRPSYTPSAPSGGTYVHPLKREKPKASSKKTCLPPSPPVDEWRAPAIPAPPKPSSPSFVAPAAANVVRVARDMREPKQQGMEAYDCGKGLRSNPFSAGSPGCSEWARGWAVASGRDVKRNKQKAVDLRPHGDKSPAWQFGFAAASRGEGSRTCPYKDDQRRREWSEGWKNGTPGEYDREQFADVLDRTHPNMTHSPKPSIDELNREPTAAWYADNAAAIKAPVIAPDNPMPPLLTENISPTSSNVPDAPSHWQCERHRRAVPMGKKCRFCIDDLDPTPTERKRDEMAAGQRENRVIRAAFNGKVAEALVPIMALRIQSAINPPAKFRVKPDSLHAATFTGEPLGRHEFYGQVTLLLAPAYTAEMQGRFLFRGNGDRWMADCQPSHQALFAKFPKEMQP